MKWVGLFVFMMCVVVGCLAVYKLCVFCHRKFSKDADKEIQAAEY